MLTAVSGALTDPSASCLSLTSQSCATCTFPVKIAACWRPAICLMSSWLQGLTLKGTGEATLDRPRLSCYWQHIRHKRISVRLSERDWMDDGTSLDGQQSSEAAPFIFSVPRRPLRPSPACAQQVRSRLDGLNDPMASEHVQAKHRCKELFGWTGRFLLNHWAAP